MWLGSEVELAPKILYTKIVQSTPKHKDGHKELKSFIAGWVAHSKD